MNCCLTMNGCRGCNKKNHIDMMLFSERIPLESENQVEDNVCVAALVSKEVEETETKQR